jgi:hypothetical protein
MKGKPFVAPDISFIPHVLIPREHIRWLLDLPENIAATWPALKERTGANYLSNARSVASDNFFLEVLRQFSKRWLYKVQDDVFEQMKDVIATTMGNDEENWQVVNLFETISLIVNDSSRCAIFGRSLSRDPKFVHSCRRFTLLFGVSIPIMGQIIPLPFRKIFGILLNIPVDFYRRKSLKMLKPVVAGRIESIRGKMKTGQSIHDEPADFITFAAKSIAERGISHQGSIQDLTEQIYVTVNPTRICFLNAQGQELKSN